MGELYGFNFRKEKTPKTPVMEKRWKNLLDDRNKDLWLEVNQRYHITLEESAQPGYLTTYDGDHINIQVDAKDLNLSAFTHELLHVYLKKIDILIAGDLRAKMKQNEKLRGIFSDSLLAHIGNCLEHVKMLPLYLQRGFENHKFIRDFSKKIIDREQLEEIRNNYVVDGVYSLKTLDIYMGKFFSMKASNNPNYNYDDYFYVLEKIDPHLFRILNVFWNNWLSYKMEEPREKYQSFLDSFLEELEKWAGDKKFE